MAYSYEQTVRSKCIGSSNIMLDGSLIQALFIEKWSEEDEIAITRAYINKLDAEGKLSSEVEEVFLLIKVDDVDKDKLVGFKITNPDSSCYKI